MSSIPSSDYSNASIKEEPLSPMSSIHESNNNLLSELFAPEANIGLIIKEEPSQQCSNLVTQPSSSSILQTQPQNNLRLQPANLALNTTTSQAATSAAVRTTKTSIPILSNQHCNQRILYSKVKLDRGMSQETCKIHFHSLG